MKPESYVDLGLPILPLHRTVGKKCTCRLGADCETPGKHPATFDGVYGADTKLVKYQEADDRIDGANIGVATGTPLPGGGFLVVLDIDPRNNGDETLGALEAEYGDLPPTPTQNTGGGGQHYFFKTKEPVNCSVVGAGIDLKGKGGYVVVEPSIHESGKKYAWDPGAHIQDMPIADLPSWVHTAVPRPRPQHSGDAAGTFLGKIASRLGWLGDLLPNGARAVLCPWNHEHTNKTWHVRSSGTVILPATAKSTSGEFRCLHSHCSNRTTDDFLKKAGRDAVNAAIEVVPLPPEPQEPKPEPVEELAPKLEGSFKGTQFYPEPSVNNIQKVLTFAPWKGVIGFDEMTWKIMLMRAPPFDRGPSEYPAEWTDRDDRMTTIWCQESHSHKWSTSAVSEGVRAAADVNSFNQLTEHLASLKWDGKYRINTWLHDYAGVPDNFYSQTVGRKWLLSAIARAFEPGCKVDYVLILEGETGRNKSQCLEILGGAWYMSDLGDITNKDAIERIRGRWIIEDAEFHSLGRASPAAAKAFLTREVDSCRPAYGRHVESAPRRCVFCITTNEYHGYLRDDTGNRRYQPVRVDTVDLHALRRDRDQLWAEAVQAYRDKEPWWSTDPDFLRVAAEEVDLRFAKDPWEDVIMNSTKGNDATLDEVFQFLRIPSSSRDRGQQHRITAALRRLGYKEYGARWSRK